jgi:hypothetical protein
MQIKKSPSPVYFFTEKAIAFYWMKVFSLDPNGTFNVKSKDPNRVEPLKGGK